ncbi:Rad9-domain-containing protein [Cladochytrium replicatum]|nr:Rad9-domain-containing protein [Cladochytrium replicatum]
MSCSLSAASTKVFARLLQGLGRFGDDLFVEFQPSSLILSTVSPARSAFVVFTLERSFFLSIQSQHTQNQPTNCKLLLKPLLSILKSKGAAADTVEKCSIHLHNDRLVIHLQCKKGVEKLHRLHFEHSQNLRAIYSKDGKCTWTIAPKVFTDWLGNFHPKLEDVTMSCSSQFVKFRSYVEASADSRSRTLQTEITLETESFDKFDAKIDAQITFSLKDFKSILTFAEQSNSPLSAYFSESNKPVAFSTHQPTLFSADFVLATFHESEASEPSQAKTATPSVRTDERANPADHQEEEPMQQDYYFDDFAMQPPPTARTAQRPSSNSTPNPPISVSFVKQSSQIQPPISVEPPPQQHQQQQQEEMDIVYPDEDGMADVDQEMLKDMEEVEATPPPPNLQPYRHIFEST